MIIVLLFIPYFAFSDNAVYKWKEDEGTTRYSDTLTPEESRKSRAVLDDKGNTVKKIDRAKTGAELEAEKQQLALELQKRKQQQAQQESDRRLLLSFRHADEISAQRDDKLKAIGASILLQQKQLLDQRQRLLHLGQSAANHERAGRAIPAALTREIDGANVILGKIQKNIDQLQAKQQLLRLDYEILLRRYQQLTAKTH